MTAERKEIYKDRLELILAGLMDVGHETADLLLPLVARFLSSYQDSYKNSRRRIVGETYHLEIKNREDRKRKELQGFKNSLQYLRRQGFVAGTFKGRSYFWSLTNKGKDHFKKIRSRRSPYNKEKTNTVIIVSYDIPESHRRSRGWVRGVLKFLDFSMVHQSVWVGNHKMPEDFLEDLKRKNIFSYIHIFEVGKQGTLAKLT